MIRALLFDLDGTLLPLENNDSFIKEYFKVLVPFVLKHLPQDAISPDDLVKKLWAATEHMVRNNEPNLTNEIVFRDHFLQATGFSKEPIWDIINEFYASVFGELDHLTRPTPLSRQICEAALQKGYTLVLATNPLFPETAIRHRMRWAGIDHIPFALITTLETMHFCKPNPNYYREIAEMLEVTPEQCLMIGNDAYEDGMAIRVGMQGYLVTDCLKPAKEGNTTITFHHEGTLEDVLAFVMNKLPDLSKIEEFRTS